MDAAPGNKHDGEKPLSIIVIGASGDLARKKIFPALFSLYSRDFFPEGFSVVGFARSDFTHESFREAITEHLTCRYVPEESCASRMEEFLSRCYYVTGRYDSSDSFLDLYTLLREIERTTETDRMFYMAIPPSLFLPVAHSIADAGLVSCGSEISAWSRVVIEKPFGHDRQSSDQLVRNMGSVFREDQVFRIDHYLGKEVIQNLMVLRFANLLFEALWNQTFIESVEISWKEDIGVGDRGRYFDRYGIIRDVMQNHLLQILALVAMERPSSLDAKDVGKEKVKVLRSMSPLKRDDLVIGQYRTATFHGKAYPSYVDEAYVASDSITPTYAAAVLRIDNDRWKGIPFILSAGKGLDSRMTEIVIRFRDVPSNVYCDTMKCLPSNRLVIRVQPDEAIYFRIINKVPGLTMRLEESDLNLRYASTFSQKIPEAYESLLLDVVRGDKSLFIGADELAAAWDIFTPVLHENEEKAVGPVPYAFGSTGLAAAETLAVR